MSNTGLYSGLYRSLYEIATLVDNVLVTLRDEEECTSKACKKLGQLLLDLSTDKSRKVSIRLLALALEDIASLSTERRQAAGKALLASNIDKKTLETLEDLARTLEQLQVQSLNRIRGEVV